MEFVGGMGLVWGSGVGVEVWGLWEVWGWCGGMGFVGFGKGKGR